MNLEPMKSFAGHFEPGDATRYDLVVVETWDTFEVVVLNDGFFDKITFLKHNKSFYHSYRGKATNPWTIKAARQFIDLAEEMSE